VAARVVCANGHPNDNVGEEMRFCQQCGAPLEVRCSSGHVSPMGRRFCPSCGESLVPVDQYPPPQPGFAQPMPTGGPPTQPGFAQPMPIGAPRRTVGRRRGTIILVIACVVVVLAAAAGGAVIVLHKNSGGSKPGQDALTRTSSTARVSTTIQNTTNSAPATTVPASTIPATTVPPPTTTTFPANMVRVKTSAVASNPLSTEVAQTFSTYFGGINDRKWAQAYSAYSPSYQQDVTLQSFESVDATSSDMDVSLMSIDEGTGGTLSVGVNFTSHQAAANGPSGETCTQWALTYMLVPSTSGTALDYLIQSAKGNDSACPA
jgi:hypothetical protein